MTTLRVVESPADLETWATLKSTVVPNEPVTAEQIVASDEEGRLLLLAELDGAAVGCGITAPSHFGGSRPTTSSSKCARSASSSRGRRRATRQCKR